MLEKQAMEMQSPTSNFVIVLFLLVIFISNVKAWTGEIHGRVVCDVCADSTVGPEDHILEGLSLYLGICLWYVLFSQICKMGFVFGLASVHGFCNGWFVSFVDSCTDICSQNLSFYRFMWLIVYSWMNWFRFCDWQIITIFVTSCVETMVALFSF